jgi:D-lactate dehydrogenase
VPDCVNRRPPWVGDREGVVRALSAALGRRNVLTGDRQTLRFRRGFRSGSGGALAVALPGSLVEQWEALRICVEARVIVIMQASNTGLTGGSTPDGDDYDRPVVIVNTLRLGRIDLIEDGRQVVCLPGATLYRLEALLAKVGRAPHSVICSSCIGASVVGGISNNSGGALVSRGPAYTECALDPTNAMNAGVGKMSKRTHYACDCAQARGFRAE